MNTATPHKLDDKGRALVSESVKRYRESIAYLERELSAQILIGSPFAILATFPGETCVRVLARVDPKTRQYKANAPHCFPSLDLMPDHLCGVCFYGPESAETNLARLTAQNQGARFTVKHLRVIQTERLARAREMLKTMLEIAEREGVEV